MAARAFLPPALGFTGRGRTNHTSLVYHRAGNCQGEAFRSSPSCPSADGHPETMKHGCHPERVAQSPWCWDSAALPSTTVRMRVLTTQESSNTKSRRVANAATLRYPYPLSALSAMNYLRTSGINEQGPPRP
jgi:hypothetical protein